MLRLLQNRLYLLLRAATPLLSPTRHRACLLLSTSPAPFSLEGYLVSACGLAPDQARKVSKQAFDEASKVARKPFQDSSRSRLNTASNPDAVLALLSGAGLSRAHIAAVVAADPLILRSSAKAVGPRLLALRDRLGLSSPQIYQFLLVGSRALRSCDVFFISFFGSFENFLLAPKWPTRLLTADLDTRVKPNILLLRRCGLSVRDIVQLCSTEPTLLGLNAERVKDAVLCAEALGVPRTSRTFKYAVAVAACAGKQKVATRLEFLKSALGCSEAEIAVSKMPTILGVSEDQLLPKIQFLLNEVGVEPQCIAKKPALLGYSLEKRLVPRHCAMKLLQSKGLLNTDLPFYSLAKIREQTFRMNFIDRYKDSVPGLADAYAATTAGGVLPGRNGRQGDQGQLGPWKEVTSSDRDEVAADM
ncbi:hypothetical protein U9M48_021522 [Paspalum notatum var. saurae]|uniref:Uncharacterized protein n=1 Tax=Paspalum notatum var. saurae TaxID=547442 RepID=A0AAQ3WTU7_PASNO